MFGTDRDPEHNYTFYTEQFCMLKIINTATMRISDDDIIYSSGNYEQKWINKLNNYEFIFLACLTI
jgi:hypothetical protein